MKNLGTVAIVRFDAFGDLFMSSGLFIAISKIYPNHDILLLVRKGFKSIENLFPVNFEWKEFDISYDSYRHKNKKAYRELIDTLHSKSIQIFIHPCYNLSWIDYSLLYEFSNSEHLSLSNLLPKRNPMFPIHLQLKDLQAKWQFQESKEKTSEYDKYSKFIKYLQTYKNKSLKSAKPSLKIDLNFQDRAYEFLDKKGLIGSKFLICNPAGVANISYKTWNSQDYILLLDWIYKKFHFKILFVCHESEKPIIEEISNDLEILGVFSSSYFGDSNGFSMISVFLSKAELYIGNDSSILHLANGLQVPTISFFSGAHWPRFLPWGNQNLIFSRKMNCFYCEWNCIYQDAVCIRSISFKDIKKDIESFIRKGYKGLNPIHELSIDVEPYFYKKFQDKKFLSSSWKLIFSNRFPKVFQFVYKTFFRYLK